MKIDILTLFPEMFDGFKNESIIKRAIESKKVEINTCNFRDFAKNKHKKVDDTPYGGGAGMVLMCQPIYDAVESLKTDKSKVIMLSPQGKPYTQKKAYELSKEEHLIFICGHYEGFDERISSLCDEEISIGDYVLTGGELPSMVITDSVVRLLPGVIEEESHEIDSFNENLLDYPTYTKPRNYKGMKVPEVLLSGDHKKIDEWRKEQRLLVTKEKRPDLLRKKMILKKGGMKKSGFKISMDDVKNIKVTEIKEDKKDAVEEKETPKKVTKKETKNTVYKLLLEEKLVAITIFNPKKLEGYKLKGRNKDGDITKILIVKTSFASKVAMKNIRKKIDILNYRLNMALQTDDNEATSRVLGESEMLKSMIIKVYSNFLSKEALDFVIQNINKLVNEFVKNKSLRNSVLNGGF